MASVTTELSSAQIDSSLKFRAFLKVVISRGKDKDGKRLELILSKTEISSFRKFIAVSLLGLLKFKDANTYRHSLGLAEDLQGFLGVYKKELKKVFPEEWIEELCGLIVAALLHDIGKLFVPRKILQKNEKLEEDEFEKVKQHVVWSVRILKFLRFSKPTIEAAGGHHEKFNGTGYPEGTTELGLWARLLTLFDAVDIMIKGRSYQNKLTADEIKADLREKSGTQFDPELVELAIRYIDSIR